MHTDQRVEKTTWFGGPGTGLCQLLDRNWDTNTIYMNDLSYSIFYGYFSLLFIKILNTALHKHFASTQKLTLRPQAHKTRNK